MLRSTVACLAITLSAPSAWAAVTVTNVKTEGGRPVELKVLRTRDGKLHMTEQGYGAEAASSAAAGAARGRAVLDDRIRNVTIFNPKVPELVSVESNGVCRVIDPASARAGAPGMPSGEQMQELNAAMAKAQKQMAEAIAKARAQGDMTPEQENAMRNFMPRLQGGAPLGQQQEIKLVPTGDTEHFGRFGEAVAYRADGGPDSERLVYWLVPTDRGRGLGEVREAIGGMLRFHREVLKQAGVGQLGSLMTAIEKRDREYPVAVDDLVRGTRDQIKSIEPGDGGISYDPDCTRRIGMFDQ